METSYWISISAIIVTLVINIIGYTVALFKRKKDKQMHREQIMQIEKQREIDKQMHQEQIDQIEKQREADKQMHQEQIEQIERHHRTAVRPYFRLVDEGLITTDNGRLNFKLELKNIGETANEIRVKFMDCNDVTFCCPIYIKNIFPDIKKYYTCESYEPQIAGKDEIVKFTLFLIIPKDNEIFWDYTKIEGGDKFSYSMDIDVPITITFKDRAGNAYEQTLQFDYNLVNYEFIIVRQHPSAPKLISPASS